MSRYWLWPSLGMAFCVKFFKCYAELSILWAVTLSSVFIKCRTLCHMLQSLVCILHCPATPVNFLLVIVIVQPENVSSALILLSMFILLFVFFSAVAASYVLIKSNCYLIHYRVATFLFSQSGTQGFPFSSLSPLLSPFPSHSLPIFLPPYD